MIRLIIEKPRVVNAGEGRGWYVSHPSNDAILAYCGTEGEANAVADALTALARVLDVQGKS